MTCWLSHEDHHLQEEPQGHRSKYEWIFSKGGVNNYLWHRDAVITAWNLPNASTRPPRVAATAFFGVWELLAVCSMLKKGDTALSILHNKYWPIVHEIIKSGLPLIYHPEIKTPSTACYYLVGKDGRNWICRGVLPTRATHLPAHCRAAPCWIKEKKAWEAMKLHVSDWIKENAHMDFIFIGSLLLRQLQLEGRVSLLNTLTRNLFFSVRCSLPPFTEWLRETQLSSSNGICKVVGCVSLSLHLPLILYHDIAHTPPRSFYRRSSPFHNASWKETCPLAVTL